VRIDQSIKTGEFAKQANVVKALDTAKNGNGRLHLLGLVSDGGVHSHILHLFALLEAAKAAGVPETYVHFFGDGRDTDPKSSAEYMQQLLDKFNSLKYGKLGTVVGRYYAMDRDKRWERIQVALDALTQGKGDQGSESPVEDIKAKYDKKETDEFLKPIIYNGQDGRLQSISYIPLKMLTIDKDTLIFFNYRSDRVREIVQILYVDPSPLEGKVTLPSDITLTTMSKYNPKWDQIPVIFPPQRMTDGFSSRDLLLIVVLGEWLSKKQIPQCHIAETEKYAHVTFFFNGGIEKQYPLEDREMVPSPKVATYDLEPYPPASNLCNN
jgi:2,3-bisphosphoglycerate-independent phosphoglycerate mutase